MERLELAIVVASAALCFGVGILVGYLRERRRWCRAGRARRYEDQCVTAGKRCYWVLNRDEENP